MTRVDFYVLSGTGADARLGFACRLAEKAYRASTQVHIEVDDASTRARLDSLLWTFRDGSFLAHDVLSAGDSAEAPVTLGSDRLLPDDRDLLINLLDVVPPFAGEFTRIAEVVTAEDDSRARGRDRYTHYRDGDYSLQSHNIS